MEFSVLNLNTYVYPTLSPTRKRRLTILGEKIRSLSPDIITLQEMDFLQRSFVPLAKGLGEPYKLYAQFHNVLFFKAATSGLAIGTTLPVQELDFIPFKKNLRGIMKGIVQQKGFLYMKVQKEKEIIHILNAHANATYSKFGNQEEIEVINDQLSQVATFIKPLQGKIIVAGDFNMTYDVVNAQGASVLDTFLARSGLEDPLRHNNAITFNPLRVPKFVRSKVFSDVKLDYILFKGFPERASITEEIIFKKPFSYKGKPFYFSDHFGIYFTAKHI